MIFLRRKSDHCLALSVPESLRQSSCWDVTDVTLVCEDHATSPCLTLQNFVKPNQLLRSGPNFEPGQFSGHLDRFEKKIRFHQTFYLAQFYLLPCFVSESGRHSSVCNIGFSKSGLHNLWQPCSWVVKKWRENEKMKMNGERMRKWREIHSLHFLIFPSFPPSLSISCIKNCLI